MRKALLLFTAIIFNGILAYSQIGGKHAFEFVNLPGNALVAGIGGINTSLIDQDLNLMFQNPALLNTTMKGKGAFNYVPYMAGIKTSSLGYAFDVKKYGTYGIGLQFTHYGTLQWTDDAGNNLGSFTPYDYYIYAGGAHTVGNYTLGASLKFAASRIHTYGSSALMTDIGGRFKHPVHDFSIGLVIKNLGVPLKKYLPGTDLNMPFDVQLGTTFKPKHMPLRVSITAHHLHQFDIAYNDPNAKGQLDLEGNEIREKISFAEKMGRHFVLGGEFILSKNFHLRFGYNYLRRRELRLQTKTGAAGFSFGGMIRIKAFEIAFSRAVYSVAGGSSYLSLIVDMNRVFSNKKKINTTE